MTTIFEGRSLILESLENLKMQWKCADYQDFIYPDKSIPTNESWEQSRLALASIGQANQISWLKLKWLKLL